MNYILYKSKERGYVDMGWLKTYHTFSFGNYYNPSAIHFGVLRVLNDDVLDPDNGFGMHPHENMEIISIPLSGALTHKDNMGHESVIKKGEIQVMSAGAGVMHSEYNKHMSEKASLLQIWLFPNQKNVTPRYQQMSLQLLERKNKFYQVLSPNSDDEGVWIYQDAWFYIGKFSSPMSVNHSINKQGNGLYVFMINGNSKINGVELNNRDGIGIRDQNEFKIDITSPAEILLMELPMAV
jgi:hypothetical protein